MQRRKAKTDRDGFYKQPNSPYYYTRIDGKRVSTGCVTLDDAKQWKSRIIASSELGAYALASSPVGLYPVLLKYIEETQHARSEITRKKLRTNIKRLSFGMLDKVKDLRQLSRSDIAAYIREHKNAKYADASILQDLRLLRSAIKWHNDSSPPALQCPTNVFKNLPLVYGSRTRFLTEDEARRFMEAARVNAPPYIVLAAELMLYAGLRLGEVMALTWDRVDLERGHIVFHASKPTSQGGQKNGKALLHPLNDAAVTALRRATGDDKPHTGPVLLTTVETRPSPAIMQHTFNAVSDAAGITPRVLRHDLRRTFGSWLLQRGVDIKTVSDLLRHSSVSVTEKIYAHLTPDLKRGALDSIKAV